MSRPDSPYLNNSKKISVTAHKHMQEMIKAKRLKNRPDEERFFFRRIPSVRA